MKLKQTLLIFAVAVVVSLSMFTSYASAQNTCGGVDTSIISCDSEGGESPIMSLLRTVISFFTVGVGVLGVGGILFGSYVYMTAIGSVDETKKAKRIILNVAIGLFVYALMFALMNFLIPGGVFK